MVIYVLLVVKWANQIMEKKRHMKIHKNDIPQVDPINLVQNSNQDF